MGKIIVYHSFQNFCVFKDIKGENKAITTLFRIQFVAESQCDYSCWVNWWVLFCYIENSAAERIKEFDQHKRIKVNTDFVASLCEQ